MSRILTLALLIPILFFSACKNRGSKSVLSDKVLNNDLKFNYLSTRAKVDYIDSEQNLSTPVQIRIRQDSAIWMSVTPALGIEMVRILIRKDSVFMINKLKKEYYAGSFDLIKQQLGLTVNYKLVEKLLIGDIPLKSTSSQKLTKTDSHYILEQLLKEFTITNNVQKGNSRLDKLEIKGIGDDTETQILYSNFTPINNVDFAQDIKLNQVRNGKKTNIDINYNKTKVSDEPLKMSFTIPSNYNEIKL